MGVISEFYEPVYDFAVESNEIEGIYDLAQHHTHAAALTEFLEHKQLETGHVESFVEMVQPNARLRCWEAVRVGDHIPPVGPQVVGKFTGLLYKVCENTISPYVAHLQYEFLHPFTDGNGRSGRAIWLWQMVKLRRWKYQLGFKHKFYYDTLSHLKNDVEAMLQL